MTRSSDSIDISLSNVYKSWTAFRRSKRAGRSIIAFEYSLEDNLFDLTKDLQNSRYNHGGYMHMVVNDSKKRYISVASVRDRVVHRLLYDYYVEKIDHKLDFDVWSCRQNKGLLLAIQRTQGLLTRYPDAWVWRSDISKFFDNIDHQKLLNIIKYHIDDKQALELSKKIIKSYCSTLGLGIAIGNLTSQILSNVYLNEFDRFVRHSIKPLGYVRYGDDFIVIMPNRQALEQSGVYASTFLSSELGLRINKSSSIIVQSKRGLHFLGLVIYANGQRIQERTWRRINQRLTVANYTSYDGIVTKFGNKYQRKESPYLYLNASGLI